MMMKTETQGRMHVSGGVRGEKGRARTRPRTVISDQIHATVIVRPFLCSWNNNEGSMTKSTTQTQQTLRPP